MMDLNMLKSLGNIKTYTENSIIFREGELGDNIYFVLMGNVEIFINSSDGTSIKVADIGPGGFFGEMSLLEGEPRCATAQAVKDTITLAVAKEGFEAFICQQPAMATKIMKVLSSRIRTLNDELAKLKSFCGLVDDNTLLALDFTSDTEEMPINEGLFDILYPKEHKPYHHIAPHSYEQYIFTKNIKCPICVNEFEIKTPWSSKLKSDGVDNDFRQRHKDFDTLWYSITVCPKCYYAGFINEYEAPLKIKIKDFMDKTAAVREKLDFKYTEPRKLSEVFTAYYLALYSTKLVEPNPFKRAKLWLQLSWLYKDVGDDVMYELAASNALESYREIVYESTYDMTPEQEQQCLLIMGELYLHQKRNEEAVKCFHTAVTRKGGSQRYVSQARDRIYDIKSKK
ncbi:MAG: DUF2225 domain-containing protein [Bacillota bacterium]